MRKIEYYICEICGTEYKYETKAEDCEKCHKTPVTIIKSRYVSKHQDDEGYPVMVEIQMSDGTFQTYKRQRL